VQTFKVETLSHSEILDHAQQASQSGNWTLVSQCLYQLLLSEDASTVRKSLFAEPQTANTLLTLALQTLEFGNFQDRWDVAKVFPSFGSDAFPLELHTAVIAPLIALLQDDESDPEAQWFVIRILGEFNHPQVVTALIEVLKASDNEDLNSMTVTALAQMGNPTIPVLSDLLDDESTRLFAVQTLGHIRHSETVPFLLNVVDDPDAQVRAIAIDALGSFHSPKITEILINALKDPATAVRRAAVSALGFCTPSDLGNVDVVACLQPMLRDFNVDVCCHSAIALSRLGTPLAADALYEVLRSPYTPERLSLEIIRALAWIGLPEALEYLHQSLTDLTLPEAARLEIVTALGRIEAPHLKEQATHILLGLLDQDSANTASIRQAISLSLGQLGNKRAIPPLIQLLADPDVGVRLHIISALKTLDAASAHQILEEYLKTESPDSELRKGIAIALQEWTVHHP
jgi:HEAT repeat protein